MSTKGWRAAIRKAENPRQGQDVYSLKQSAIRNTLFATLCYYLLNNDGECQVAAREALRQAEEYFFGDWRTQIPSGNYHDKPPDPAYWRSIAAWSDCYIETILWATCLDEWEAVDRFSEYVTDEVELDIEQSPENRAWLLSLAATLRTYATSADEYATGILNSTRERERLLTAMLQGIVSRNEARVHSSADAYFSFYLRSERKKPIITSKVMTDGTVLINLAMRLGVPLQIPDDITPHVVTPKFKK